MGPQSTLTKFEIMIRADGATVNIDQITDGATVNIDQISNFFCSELDSLALSSHIEFWLKEVSYILGEHGWTSWEHVENIFIKFHKFLILLKFTA